MKVYFAHPMAYYGTPKQQEALKIIECYFSKEILNPDGPSHLAAAKFLGMDYFVGLVKTCDALVAMPFDDGEYGAGVYLEIATMAAKGGDVYAIKNGVLVPIDYRQIRPLSIAQTRARISLIKGAKGKI